MIIRLITSGSVLGLVTLTGQPVHGLDPQSPPDRIVVKVMTINGSGCPRGSVLVAERADGAGFTVTYRRFRATVGPGVRVTDSRKNCQLGLRVYVPQGFTYAIARVDYRGYALLQNGAGGLRKTSYYFQGQSQTASAGHALRAPFNGRWQDTDTARVTALVYRPCGAISDLNVNAELRVNAGTSSTERTTSYLAMDSMRGGVNTIYHFRWRRCP